MITATGNTLEMAQRQTGRIISDIAPVAAEQGARELLNLSAEQELADRRAELDFAAAMSGLTILRHAST